VVKRRRSAKSVRAKAVLSPLTGPELELLMHFKHNIHGESLAENIVENVTAASLRRSGFEDPAENLAVASLVRREVKEGLVPDMRGYMFVRNFSGVLQLRLLRVGRNSWHYR